MKEDYFKILRQLRKHHSLFAQFWTVGHLIEVDTPDMPTAAVAFDKKTGRGLQFLINPKFWAHLDDHAKAFVISHEILHVYLDHGRRMLGLDPQLANIAQDVVINHQLVDIFGFSREDLIFGENYCWRDTVFPDRQDIDADRCFEYYYQKLEEQGGAAESEGRQADGNQPNDGEASSGFGQGKNKTVDTHNFTDGVDQDSLDAIQDSVEDLVDRITPGEIEDFEGKITEGSEDEAEQLKKQQAGTMGGCMSKKIRLGKVKKKRKWEEVVCDILGRFHGARRDMDIELWTRDNRRLAGMDNDLVLPASVTETVTVCDKIDVWCFQDTSGSCEQYAKRFFKSIATIPDDRFRVRVFCFDTKVYETSLASGKLYGFGGTRFQPIEDAIQQIMRDEEKTNYPQAVFVVTDGYGAQVTPEFPNRWHWFMTDHNNTRFVPSASQHYQLSHYE